MGLLKGVSSEKNRTRDPYFNIYKEHGGSSSEEQFFSVLQSLSGGRVLPRSGPLGLGVLMLGAVSNDDGKRAKSRSVNKY